MPPEIKVNANLRQLLEQLDKVSEHAKKTSEELKKTVEGVGEALADETKKVETAFEKMSRFGRRIATQLKGDMKAMIGLNAVQSGLAINNMFRGSISKVASLNDAVRKLGAGFGIQQGRFSSFQSAMMKGLGEIGLSAEDAAKTMEGLSGTGVKGEGNVMGYSKVAGQLTSIGNEKGSEGQVAKALSEVVRAKGGDVNNIDQVTDVAREVTKAMETTGASASKILDAMNMTYQGASKSGRAMVSLRGAAQSAIADQVTGGNVSGLIKSMTSLPPEMRARSKAMGLSGMLGKNGEIDIEGVKKFAKKMKEMGTSPELASQIIAGNEEFGDTIMRLIDSADRLDTAFKNNAKASDDFGGKMNNQRGLKEAFEANINRTSSILAKPFSRITQGLSDALSATSQSGAGAATVVGGAALLSATLAAGGGRAILGSLMGSAKGSALQAIDKDIQKVFVVNASEMGGGTAGQSLVSKMGEKIKGILPAIGAVVSAPATIMAAAAVAGGYGISQAGGAYIESQGDKFRENMTPSDKTDMASAFAKMAGAMEQATGKNDSKHDVNVTISNKASQFDTKSTINRGKAQ